MFKKDFERTPQEKARRAQFSILARLGGCGYLVYIMVQLLQTPKEEQTTLMVVLAIVLLAASVLVIVFTIYDLFRALKTGRFNPAYYEDAENNASVQPVAAEPEARNDSTAETALEEHLEDEADEDSEDGKDE
jgi:hypothetical protein